MLDYSIHYKKWHDGSKIHFDETARFYRRILGDVFASIPAQARILDVGCGQGLLIYALREAGYRDLQGIDLSEQQVEVSKQFALPCTAVNAEYLFQLAESSPASFDLIFLMDVLEHLPKPEQLRMLRAISSLLKPAGQLVLSVPNANSTFGLRWRHIDWTHEAAFTEHSLEFILLNCGFQDLQFLPYEFITRPRLPFIPRRSVFSWLLHKFFRSVRRLEAVAEMGSDGWQVPLSLNLLARCVKADAKL